MITTKHIVDADQLQAKIQEVTAKGFKLKHTKQISSAQFELTFVADSLQKKYIYG